MQNWIVLIPPIIVLLIAILKRNVILSLAVGILTAALIATRGSIIQTILLSLGRLYEETNFQRFYDPSAPSDHLYIFGFIILLGIIISIITHTGGIEAYSKKIASKFKDKKNVETTSLIFSLALFLDDYLNSFTVGCLMRPLTDKFKIPRIKLAFLLNSMSAPLCVIIPATSWLAFILSQLENSGIREKIISSTYIIGDSFSVYLRSIIFMFYPILVIVSSWLIVRKTISFGYMKTQEDIASKTGNVFGNKETATKEMSSSENSKTNSIASFIIPLSLFFITLIFSLLFTGGWSLLKPSEKILYAFLHSDPFISLFVASLISASVSIILFLIMKKINLNQTKNIVIDGFDLMKNSLLLLLLAWTFGSLLEKDLKTGSYLAKLLLSALPTFALPLTIFFTAIFICASTGSAWGTIAILVPLVIPSVIAFSNLEPPAILANIPLIYPVIGALISGSIAGGHISPISDSTIVASTSAGANHLDHVRSQIPYVIPAILGTCFAFLIAGKFISYGYLKIGIISLIIGLIITVSILLIKNYYSSKNNST